MQKGKSDESNDGSAHRDASLTGSVHRYGVQFGRELFAGREAAINSNKLHRSTIDFLQSSFSGLFAAKSSRMAVTSTAWAGAAPREEDVVEAAGGVGLVGATVPTVLVGEATAGEAGTALVEGAAVACPNIFDMRLVNIPITAKDTPRRDKKPAPVVRLAAAQSAKSYRMTGLTHRRHHDQCFGCGSRVNGISQAFRSPFAADRCRSAPLAF